MQPFDQQTSNGEDPVHHCAGLLLETMPRVLKAVRAGLAAEKSPVTMPQYRTLLFVAEHKGASLSDLADFLGLALPSVSKLVDHLVKRAILVREADLSDRRKITLRVSRTGDALFKSAQRKVRLHLAEKLRGANANALRGLGQALMVLQENFPPVGGDYPRRRGGASPTAV